MNTSKQPQRQQPPETESNISDLMLYIKAAKGKFPSKEELFAEVNRDRDNRKKVIKTVQYTAALVFCALGVWTVNPAISTGTYSTRYAENAQYTLHDGSKVHLNSNTTLVTKLRLRSREIMLDKGEAAFTVKHELRPFMVAVNNSTVLDIGTVFNISKWQQSFVTTVLEGEVELQTGEQKNRLTAGQSIHVTDLEAGAPYLAEMEMVTAWHTGKILFNKTRLKDAIASIQRYREAPIQLDPRVEDMLITGIYDISKVEQLLDSMDTMFPVIVTRANDGEINIQKIHS
ncbi:MAG: FecR family protein [Methylophilus sp.]